MIPDFGPPHGRHQSGLESIELNTRRAQPCDLNHRGVSDPQQRASRKLQQVDPSRGDILAHLTGSDREPELAQFVE